MNLEQSNPLVTVYIPTFNRVELLKRAVESVRHQTYQNLEIIIVDDCSNDNTHGYLEEISKQDSRIRYFVKEKNSGACVSRNIAIENAKGEFITGLDDDDYFLKERIELFLRKWEKRNVDCIALYSLYKHKVSDKKIKDSFLKKIIRRNYADRKTILVNNLIGNQIFVETAIMKQTGGFDPNLPAWQDFECWYRLLGNQKFYLVKESTYVVDTSHPFERITQKKISKIKEAYNYFRLKHSLTGKYGDLLYAHLYNYDINLASYSFLIKNFFIYGNYYSLFKLIQKIKLEFR